MAEQHSSGAIHISPEELATLIATAVADTIKQHKILARDEAADIALASATVAVNKSHTELFGYLGYNIADQKERERLRANLNFLETARTRTSSAINTVVTGIIMALLGFVLFLLGVGAHVSVGMPSNTPSIH